MEPMYAAMAKIRGTGTPCQHVTLAGQVFMANEGLIDDLIAASSAKHPDWEFSKIKIEERQHA